MADRIAVMGEPTQGEQDIHRASFKERARNYLSTARVEEYFSRRGAEAFCKAYGITGKDIDGYIRSIEEFTGLKFNRNIRSSNLKLSVTDTKGFEDLMDQELQSCIKELGGVVKHKMGGLSRDRVVKIRGKEFDYEDVLLSYETMSGLRGPDEPGLLAIYREGEKIVLRTDAINVSIAAYLTNRKNARLINDADRYIVGDVLKHEIGHQLIDNNNPALFKEISELLKEKIKLGIDEEFADEKTKPLLIKREKEIGYRLANLVSWHEALAEHITEGVRGRSFEGVADSKEHEIRKGRELIVAIGAALEKKPSEEYGKNAIMLAVKNPPLSLEELENPQKYLERMIFSEG